MREILFRGKRKDNGEWVEGIPIKTYDTEIGLNLPLRYNPKSITLMNTDRVLLCCAMDDSAYFDTEDYPIIDDETIGQYTGLKDKNGVRVFEGDILKNTLDNSISVVEWGEAHTGFTLKTRGTIYGFPKIGHEVYKIIGNIYDNPELMGGNTNG